MDPQNLAYALVQLVHNFGAVAVVGSAAAALWLAPPASVLLRALAWTALGGWAAQAASGATFGAVSYFYYGRFPDLHGIAVAALMVKMACATAGIVLAAAYLRFGAAWSQAGCRVAWHFLLGLAVIALSAAAFLRWFS